MKDKPRKRDLFIRRAIRLSLDFTTAKKRKSLSALLQAYRGAVNFYIKSLWAERGKLDKDTLARLPRDRTRLSERLKSDALKQALEIVISTRKSAKAIKKYTAVPRFKGRAVLDAKIVTVEKGLGSFDLVLMVSSLHKGHKICVPTRHTRVSRKWLGFPGAKLVHGCSLTEKSITIWVEFPRSNLKEEGKVLAIDLGVNKLLVDSEGNQYGRDFKRIRDKILKRSPGSKGRQRAYAERDNYLHRTIKELPWSQLRVLGVEDLRDMKRGKKKGRGKSFRRALAPWVYRRVLNWICSNAEENRVRLIAVDPANTSRQCPICGTVDKANRRGERFECVLCGYKQDSDYVGALNILDRTRGFLGSLESPSSLVNATSQDR